MNSEALCTRFPLFEQTSNKLLSLNGIQNFWRNTCQEDPLLLVHSTEKLVRTWPWSCNNKSLWSTWHCLETPTLPSMCTPGPNGDHQHHAMESLFRRNPAKDHVPSSWAWPHLISTSGKALLRATALGYFTLDRESHTSFGAVLSWFFLTCCLFSTSMSTQATQKQPSISKYPFTAGWEWKLSGGSSCWSWALHRRTEKLVFAVKVWPPPPPQKPSLLLLDKSPGYIHKKNLFLQLLREVFCPKTFTVSGGHLWEGQWPLFPAKSMPSHQWQISCHKVQFMEFM